MHNMMVIVTADLCGFAAPGCPVQTSQLHSTPLGASAAQMAQLATEVKDTLGALEHRWCPSTQQNSVFATRKVLAGTVISRFDAKEVTTAPTMYTVQIPLTPLTCCNSLPLQTGENEHIVLQPTLLEYINHSCNPTAFFDTAERQLVALRDIQPGDEVTFNYVSTEFDMATPFDCHCGEESCFGRISGAAHVPQAQLEKCRLNAHISRMLAARDAKSLSTHLPRSPGVAWASQGHHMSPRTGASDRLLQADRIKRSCT
ncbi:hypothetical protein QJQ45_015846 [Haematococcus lacustris]|nr:hypothetical protein QJQ45_015846 [Haematococcus lacustris]